MRIPSEASPPGTCPQDPSLNLGPWTDLENQMLLHKFVSA